MSITISNSNNFIIMSSSEGTAIIYAWQFFLILGITIAVTLALYILMGIGLLVMAKKREIKNGWLAFVPFLRYYLLGKIVGKINLFGKQIKNLGVVAVITSALTYLTIAVINIYNFLPAVIVFFQQGSISFILDETTQELAYASNISFSYDTWFVIVTEVCTYINAIADLVNFFVILELFIELYKKYAPDHYFMYAILTLILNIGGIFVFAIRNRQAVSYAEYIKEKFLKMNGGYMAQPTTPAPEDPFKEFAKRGEYDPGDPFSEFSSSPSNDTEENSNATDDNDNTDGEDIKKEGTSSNDNE